MMSTQQRLWDCMQEAQALANELQRSDLAVAGHGLERAYRDLHGPDVPAGLALEATGVMVSAQVSHAEWPDKSAVATVELYTLTPVGDVRLPLRTVTLGMEVSKSTWGAISDTLRSPKGRVRMRFDFYDSEEGSGHSSGPALPGGTF